MRGAGCCEGAGGVGTKGDDWHPKADIHVPLQGHSTAGFKARRVEIPRTIFNLIELTRGTELMKTCILSYSLFSDQY